MSLQIIQAARQNLLLNGLSEEALAGIATDLQPRTVRVRDWVVRRKETIEDVYFPLTCVLSTVAEGTAGEVVEVATVGNEGVSGVSIFLGVDSTSTLDTFAQIPGEALWMRAREFRTHLQNQPALTQIMGRYTQALLTQISQSSACNRLHPAEERCARWLLMSHDRVGRNEFELTQEFLGQMLGMRRATVGEVAAALQDAGIIRYLRGIVTIIDRVALEERTCECYRIIRDEYTRLLPPPRPINEG